jgi:very-short-patch-repair endonuclease
VDHLVLAAGAVLLMPDGAAIAGRSAAILWGAPVIGSPDRVEIIAPTKFGPISGLGIRVARLDPAEVTMHRGLPVTSSLHTAWDLARLLPLVEAVKWVDSLARVRRLTIAELRVHGEVHPGVAGIRRAGETLKLCDPKAESPPESEVRLHLHLAGIMVIPQFWVVWNNECIARVDFAIPEIKLAIEYDGQWHGDPGQLGRDRVRVRRRLNKAGWYVFQITKEDLRNVGNLIHNIQEVIDQLKRSRV